MSPGHGEIIIGDRRQKKDEGDGVRLPPWAVPLLIGVIATAAVAQFRLNGKEDATSHAADVRMLQGSAELKAVRDSAQMADVRRMLRDLACPTNPTKDYCK